MKLFLKKYNNQTFLPAGDTDYEKAAKIPLGEILEIDFKKQRNPDFHRKFFALLELVFLHKSEKFDWIVNREQLREQLTLTAGYYETIVDLNGEVSRKMKSISFESMDQVEFEQYYSDVLDIIYRRFDFDNEFIEKHLTGF